MKTVVNRKISYERIHTCEICGKTSRYESDILKCERGHSCSCEDVYYELEQEEYSDYIEIKKICKNCGISDTIKIFDDEDRDLKDIWDLMSSKRLMENVDGNKNQN